MHTIMATLATSFNDPKIQTQSSRFFPQFPEESLALHRTELPRGAL